MYVLFFLNPAGVLDLCVLYPLKVSTVYTCILVYHRGPTGGSSRLNLTPSSTSIPSTLEGGEGVTTRQTGVRLDLLVISLWGSPWDKFGKSRYPLKLHFRIPCVFPVWWQIFPVPIDVICHYYIHTRAFGTCKVYYRKICLSHFLLL